MAGKVCVLSARAGGGKRADFPRRSRDSFRSDWVDTTDLRSFYSWTKPLPHQRARSIVVASFGQGSEDHRLFASRQRDSKDTSKSPRSAMAAGTASVVTNDSGVEPRQPIGGLGCCPSHPAAERCHRIAGVRDRNLTVPARATPPETAHSVHQNTREEPSAPLSAIVMLTER